MKQRLIDEVYEGAVKLGLAAADFELDLLALFGRQLSHRAIESAKDIVDHHHSHLQDALLEFSDKFAHLHARRAEPGNKVILGKGRLDVRHYLVHRRAGYHHFSGEVQKSIDTGRLYADVFGAPSLAGCFGRYSGPGGGPGTRSRLDCGHSESVRTRLHPEELVEHRSMAGTVAG